MKNIISLIKVYNWYDLVRIFYVLNFIILSLKNFFENFPKKLKIGIAN